MAKHKIQGDKKKLYVLFLINGLSKQTKLPFIPVLVQK